MNKNRLRCLTTRLPEHLRKQLADAAKSQRRSLNTEMIRRLEETFEHERLRKVVREELNDWWHQREPV